MTRDWFKVNRSRAAKANKEVGMFFRKDFYLSEMQLRIYCNERIRKRHSVRNLR